MQLLKRIIIATIFVIPIFFSGIAMAGSVSRPVNLHSTLNKADYIIIGADLFFDSTTYQKLSNYRAQTDNFNVAIVPLKKIYEQFPQSQKDKSIKDFISFAYYNWRENSNDPKLKYILLIGDANVGSENQRWFLPAHLNSTLNNYEGGYAADNFYVCLNDDNRDGKVDDWDNIPDLKIGRFPVKTDNELSIVIQKTLDFERYDVNKEELKRVFFTQTKGDDGPLKEVWSKDEDDASVQRNFASAHKEIIEKIGDTMDDSYQDRVDIINSGIGLLFHHGHGDRDRIQGILSSDDITKLTNSSAYPVVLSICCSTGTFHSKYADCIGEKLLTADQKGSVAFFGASFSAQIWQDNKNARIFSKNLLASPNKRLGDIIYEWKNLPKVTNKDRQIYHLFGDPALNISKLILSKSEKPDLTLSDLKFNNSSPSIGDNIIITVSAKNLGTSSNGAKIKFFKGDPDNGGTQLGIEHNINLQGETKETILQDWVVDEWGDFDIYAKIEPSNLEKELCIGNNKIRLSTIINTCLPNWPKETYGRINKISVADIDPTYCGQEVIAGSTDGNVYLWHGDGTEVRGWEGGKWVDSEIYDQPAIADIDNDSTAEIIISSTDTRLFAFRADGKEYLPGSRGVFAVLNNGLVSAPSIGDVDKDSTGLEVICTVYPNKVYAYHSDGSSMLPGKNGFFAEMPPDYRINGGVSLADINIDGEIEVLAISPYAWGSAYSDILRIFVWNCDGTPLAGWENGIAVGSSSAFSYPVIAEIDPDYPGLEIALSLDGKKPLFVLHADGTFMEGWDFELSYESDLCQNLVMGDLDPVFPGPEIAVLRKEDKSSDYWTPGQASVYAFHYDGTFVSGWENGIAVPNCPNPRDDGFIEKYYISIADIDGDEMNEVIVAAGDGLIVALNNDGTLVSGWGTKKAGYVLTDAPIIADINGNGTADLVIGSTDWSCYAWDLGVPLNRNLMDWPMLRQNPQNTGFLMTDFFRQIKR